MGYHLPTADDDRASGLSTKYLDVHRKTHGGPIFDWILSSKYTDSETGLIYYGYRYYQTETGRWISRDPITERGGRNVFSFLGNNPIKLIDPWGLLALKFEFSDGVTITDSESPSGHAWHFANMRGEGLGDGGVVSFGVECSCVACTAADVSTVSGCWKIECKIKVGTRIRISEGFKGSPDMIADTYGHEQRHVQNDRTGAKKGAAARKILNQATVCMSPSDCANEAKIVQNNRKIDLQHDLDAVNNNGYDGAGHYNDPIGPREGASYPPIGTVPEVTP